MTYFFVADEHFGHARIIEYTNRPFASVEEMDAEIIRRHNEVVGQGDIVIHAGDFTLAPSQVALTYIAKLNGGHKFIRGSHDRWLPKDAPTRMELRIGQVNVVVDHYAGRVWPKSHYNSWQFYGHSHGGLPPIGKQWDVGVDNNDFYPNRFDKLVEIMANRPDNFNLVKGRR
jgi:calcineurin-like phosphoesterase family protein